MNINPILMKNLFSGKIKIFSNFKTTQKNKLLKLYQIKVYRIIKIKKKKKKLIN